MKVDSAKKRTSWNKGLKMPPEYGEARRHSFLGQRHSQETKDKISNANKGHEVTPEMRQRMSAKAKDRLAENSANWQGGKDKVTFYGYVYEFDATMPPTRGGRYKPRYRRVMEEKLGRKLGKNETVHHINGIKADDSPDNLYLCTISSHRKMHNEMSRLVMELYQRNLVRFEDGRYYFSEPKT